jgi:HSP20 family protein
MAYKKSFFEKLTGSIKFSNDDEYEVLDINKESPDEDDDDFEESSTQEYDEVGELSIDMYQVNGAIIIRTMVAGIQKSEIDITLTRDCVQIQGSRQSEHEGAMDETYFQELYWGAFERTIDLPEEIDIELAEAEESHGLLTLILPLVDRGRHARLKIK